MSKSNYGVIVLRLGRFQKCLIAAATGLLLVAGAVSAESIEFETRRFSTPVYLPSPDFDPPLGTYTYEVSWQGIPAASATITVERDGDKYRIGTKAKTFSGIDMFYKLRYRALGVIDGDSLTPIRTEIEHRENSRVKSTQIDYLSSGQIYSVHATAGRGATVKVLDTKNFTLDPFSASFLARGIEWTVGKTAHFDVFNGRSRYLISLTAESLQTIEADGVEREVFVIVPQVKNLDDDTTSKKLRRAEIFVTADSRREILKIKSSVFIGAVSTTLEHFEPNPLPIVEARVHEQTKSFVK